MAYTAIDDPSAHFQTLIYTGNGVDGRSLANTGNSDLQPDFVWIKNRGQTDNHMAFDSTRGEGWRLKINATSVESEDVSSGYLNGFASDGFTVTSGTSGDDNVNKDTETYVAWQWKANGGTRTTNAEVGDNPAGGYQANTTSGFSIVDYTGTGAAGTMAHGLGAVPHFMIFRNRDNESNWPVYHHKNTSAPETDYINLDVTAATADNSTFWNDTAPTSTVFTVGTDNDVNQDGQGCIAYVFTSIQGYSKFGFYTGNGNADGPFVYTGFKPAWLLVKNTTSAGNSWVLLDNKRQGYNPENDFLFTNASDAESVDLSNHGFDFLSNGFKNRGTGQNDDGDNFIYMAFAEQPFVTSGGVPATAR